MRSAIGTALFLGFLAVVVIALLNGPEWILARDGLVRPEDGSEQQSFYIEQVVAARTQVGAFILGATAISGAVVSVWKLGLDRRTVELAQRTQDALDDKDLHDRIVTCQEQLVSGQVVKEVAAISTLTLDLRHNWDRRRGSAKLIATILATYVIEASRAPTRPDDAPSTVQQSLLAFQGIDEGSFVWSLRNADFRGWNLALPRGIVLDLRAAELAGAKLTGRAGVYLRASQMTLLDPQSDCISK